MNVFEVWFFLPYPGYFIFDLNAQPELQLKSLSIHTIDMIFNKCFQFLDKRSSCIIIRNEEFQKCRRYYG